MRKIRKTAVRMEDNGSYLMVIFIPNKETLSPKYSLGCIYTSVSTEKLFSPVWEYVAQRSNLHLLFFFVPHLSWSFGHQGVRRGLELRLGR